jgi:4-amino-4-deoxy-L-arabinose transferase-like glycosyltransferase
MTERLPTIPRLIPRSPLVVDLLLLLAIGGTVLLSFLGQNRNWASREIRHAEIMREMAESGDFLIPRLMGEVYYDKPPVMHFIGATLMRASGEPNLFHARFPSALAALISMLAVYGLGRMLGGHRVRLWAAFALLAMPGFWIMARVARPDLTLVALILLSCLFLGWAMQRANGWANAGWLVASGAASALAVITKGPYGLLVPLLFLAFAPRENRALVRPGWRFLWFGAGCLLMLGAWAGPVYLRDGGEYLRGVLFQEDLSTGGGSGHFEPFYWYLGSGFLQSLPVILFLPLAIRQWRRERRFPAALVIAAVILFVISCVPGKRRHYLLPLLPFLALGLAAGIARLAQSHRVLRRLALAIVIGGVVAGPLYYGPILHWLRPQGDSEWDFITDVAEALPPDATVVCFGAMDEYLAWVRRDHRRIIGVETLAEAEAALGAGKDDRYLVASDDDLLALENDPDLDSLHPVLERRIDRKGPWLLAHLQP